MQVQCTPHNADTFNLGPGKSVLIMERCPDFRGEIVLHRGLQVREGLGLGLGLALALATQVSLRRIKDSI